MTPHLYLAGPEVFHPDAARLGEAKRALCAHYGFTGLYPLEGDPPDPTRVSASIYDSCRAMMQRADAGVFNLTPFRGPSADVGTVFEFGIMAAMGKPLFAYTNEPGDLIDRLRADRGLRLDDDGTTWRDPDGMSAEDFGNADNLMIDEALFAQGRRIHRHAAAVERRFTDLAGFEACLTQVRATLRPGL